MPCISKKYEAKRDELENEGYSDVDTVITTRELAEMIKEVGIDFTSLEDSDFDNPMGESTGAGDIFGTSGGVIEATVRTAYNIITEKDLEKVEFYDLRGLDGIKYATVDIEGREIKIAVANGLGNTRRLLEKLKNKEISLDAIEVMACPGGCIGGGGQPYDHGDISILKKRSEGLYKLDESKKLRKSYENPYIKDLYDEYLKEPGSEKAHNLLHTSYKASPKL